MSTKMAGSGDGGTQCLRRYTMMCNVPGSWFLVPGSWFLVPGSWFLVTGYWLLVPGATLHHYDTDRLYVTRSIMAIPVFIK